MKKIITIIACSIMGACLCACAAHTQPLATTGLPSAEVTPQVTEIQPPVTEMPTQPTQAQQDHLENEIPPTEEMGVLETASEKLTAILSGLDSFFCQGYGKHMTIDEYCSTFGDGSDVTVEITKYTFVDLDGDQSPEAVLWVTANGVTDYGTMVLRYQTDGVVGYDFTYRQMIDLKKDGTFGYSGGTADTGCASLTFTEDSWEYRKIACVMENEDAVTYMCNGEVVSEEEYWQYMDEQDAKEGVEWIVYQH